MTLHRAATSRNFTAAHGDRPAADVFGARHRARMGPGAARAGISCAGAAGPICRWERRPAHGRGRRNDQGADAILEFHESLHRLA